MSDEPITPPADEINLMTWDQAAAVFGVSVSTFKRMAYRDRIPFYTVGRRKMFDRADLMAYRQSLRTVPEGPSYNLPDRPSPSPVKYPGRVVPSVLSEQINKPGRKFLNPFLEKHLKSS